MDAGDDDVEPGEQLGLLVEAAVLEDVDLDAGEDAERGELGVQPGDDVELHAQPLRAQPARDGEPGRVVGEGDVLVPELDRGAGHVDDRGAAVGPLGVGVQVAPQPAADGVSALGERHVRPLLQGREVVRHPAARSLHRDPGGARPDVG